ncbi:MAG: TetR/AcrR family transcriptional regulator [Gammaproteobacteria bacterium]|nr:TetR/AcrR family transcriptional regulator [Gammaproteobacteria bacterium]
MVRPIQFDRDQVLDRAMDAFWDQGYCATSMSSLVKRTKLNPGSIYAAFQSKEGLFLASLNHYGAKSLAQISSAIAAAETPLEGIRKYLHQLAARSSDPESRRGCFLVNTVLELAHRDEKVRASVNRHFDAIEQCFREALQRAQQAGELRGDRDPEAMAGCLMATIWGLRVMSGTGSDADRTQAVVSQLLRILD